jgi:hypothetical protein
LEITPGLIISAIVALVVVLTAFAGIIGGFVRMESKTNQHTLDINDLYQKVDSHEKDARIHHDGEDLNRRFTVVEEGIKGINDAIKSGFEKINDRIDRLMNK